MALRIVPKTSNPSTFSHTSGSASAPSAPGLHDTLRAGLGPILGPSPLGLPGGDNAAAAASPPVILDSDHPLEARLKNWEASQFALRQQILCRSFGIGEAARREMELKTVREGEWRPVVLGLGRPSIHEDILMGNDTTITWEDVFTGEETRRVVGFHEEMEKKLGI